MIFDSNGKTQIAEGGEGIIYDCGKDVVKIYKSNVDLKSKEKRIKALINTNLPAEVIKPTDIVTDRKGNFIGMKMPKVYGDDFKKLSNKKYVKSNNINTKDILTMLSRFWDIIQELHSKNIFIGDLNDQNILFDCKSKHIFLIDTDSWSIGTEKCEVAMDLFKDPKLIKNNFNAETDTYAFCVLAWKTLTRIHPFGGVMNPDIHIMDRISKGISVIDNPNVKMPKTTRTWVNLSPEIVSAFKSVFNDGSRKFDNHISNLLNNLTYCSTDDDYYFSDFSSCPICNASAMVVKKAISIGVENGFNIAKVLSQNNIKTVYSNSAYLDTDGYVVDVKTGNKYKNNGGRVLFEDCGGIIDCYYDHIDIHNNGIDSTVDIMPYSYPILDSNFLFYISTNGYLLKLKITDYGIGKNLVQKCSTNSFFNVKNGKYCIVNIYDKELIINIDGYFRRIDFDKKVMAGWAHYDKTLDRWLIIIEDTSSKYHSFVLDHNNVVWKSDKINYKCQVYNVDIDKGVIYIPIDNAIRGLNISTLAYKDFSCSIVDSGSILIKNGSQFIIVNDDNIYRFYK